MATPVVGVGFLLVNDLLTDVSYQLFEPVVNTLVPTGGITAGAQTVDVWDPSMYEGAMLLVGVLGGDLEVVTISVVTPGVSFAATFANSHLAGEPIIGATFPVQSTAGDPFWTQEQMLTYISTAVNDLLVRVPLCYAVSSAVSFGPTQRIAPLPSDCQVPMRVAVAKVALRETSQSNLDSVDFRWSVQAPGNPYTYFRDKIGLQNISIWPIPNNVVNTEIVYAQRSAQLLGLADGFLLPDPFCPIIKARVLEFCYSGDSEQRSPALAKLFNSRFENGIKIATVLMEVINDTSMQ